MATMTGERRVRRVLDPTESRRVTEQAIRQVDENAAEEWRERLEEAVTAVARRNPYITADLVWEYIGEPTLARTHRERSALGPVMRRAVAAGELAIAPNVRMSQRPSQHQKGLKVWRSLLYKGPINNSYCPTCGQRTAEEN